MAAGTAMNAEVENHSTLNNQKDWPARAART
jgi:hypothetical protein